MKQAARSNLRLLPHTCPLCGLRDQENESVLFSARLGNAAFSERVFSARRAPDKLHYRLVRCPHDGLVRSDPIAPVDELDRLYTRSQFNYDKEVELLTKTYLNALQPVLKELGHEARIVEVGCGNGYMIRALQQQGFTQVQGVEPSRHAVNKAEKSIKTKIIQKPFAPSLFPPASLDAIILFQTLDHIPNVSQFVEECYQLLKPGGYFFSFHHDVGSPLVSLLGETHPIIDVEHTQLFDERTSKALLTKHGFLIHKLDKPSNHISLQHLAMLLPFPEWIKSVFQKSSSGLWSKVLGYSLKLHLGNIAVSGKKPTQTSQLQSAATINSNLRKLTTTQKKLRRVIVKWSHELHLSHLGSCLSCVDIITAIYEVKRTHDDFILSSGHAAFGWYAVLVHQKLLTPKIVRSLSVHPDRKIENGISVSSGSLGQGLPIAVGKALGNRLQHVYCLTSDGEWSEGSMVEGLRVAISSKLANLTIVVNCNGWGAYRETPISQLRQELSGFEIDLLEIDGHDPKVLNSIFKKAKKQTRVTVILARTSVEQIPALKGQAAHYHVLSRDEYKDALKVLE